MIDPKLVKLVLASASPRRAQLLTEAGFEFEVRTPELAEETIGHGDPRMLVTSLAYAKARRVADELDEGIVLGADTVVCLPREAGLPTGQAGLSDEIVGNPHDADEARRILSKLSGTTHSVLTGVCLVNARRGERLMGYEKTVVRMKKLTDRELDDYVQSGEGIGKAGAYAVQENGDRFVEIVEGSFSNVVGLPMELTNRLIDEMMNLIYRA